MKERSKKPRLTPISELGIKKPRILEEELTVSDSDRDKRLQKPEVILNFSLPPHIDTTRIGIDNAQLERLCRIAGFARLVITVNNQPTSQRVEFISHGGESVTMEIFGMFFETVNATLQPKSSTKANVYLIINIEDLQKDVHELTTTTLTKLHETEAWSQALQKRLKSQMKLAARDHLVNRLNFSEIIGMIFIIVIMIGVALRSHSAESVVKALILTTIIAKLVDFVYSYNSQQQVRFSALYGPEFDRAAWFRIASWRRALIGVMPEETMTESEFAALQRLIE